jgi:hypothetical protein
MGVTRSEGKASEVDSSKETDNRKHTKNVDEKGT